MEQKILKEFMAEERKIKQRNNAALQTLFPEAELNNSGRFDFYENVDSEYKAFRRGVAIRDISDNTIIDLQGADVISFLHRISTNDIASLDVNHTTKTLFANVNGGIVGRTSVLRLPERVFLLGNFQNNQRLSIWIRNFITKEDIKLSDLTGEYCLFELYGPQTDSYLSLFCGNEVEEMQADEIRTFSIDGFVFHLIKTRDAAGKNKYWMMLLNQNSDEFINYLYESKSVFDVRFVGEKAFEIFRVEEGIPLISSELNGFFTPLEANLMSEVDTSKQSFIGHDAILKKNGLIKHHYLCGVVFENPNGISVPMDVFNHKNEEVGILTSKVESKQLNKNVALAFLNEDFIKENPVEIYSADRKKITISITKLPFRK